MLPSTNLANESSTKSLGRGVSINSAEQYVAEIISQDQANARKESSDTELEEEIQEAKPIRWINIIFLPFLGWWKVLLLFTACTKCLFGPLSAVYPKMRCTGYEMGELNLAYQWELWVKFYTLGADILYIIDTFFYIVHRQVTDEAMKREYLPKRGFHLILDIISLIPFFPLFSEDICSQVVLFWPNVLAFTEMVLIYRISQYFSLRLTHSSCQLICGYTLLLLLTVNALTSFLMVITENGLCNRCLDKNTLYDWRGYKWFETVSYDQVSLMFYAANYVISILIHYLTDETKPSTYLEHLYFVIVAEIGFYITLYILKPKLFAEFTLRNMKLFQFQPRVKRVLREIKRRNPDGYNGVRNFYSMMWMKQNGITDIPEVIYELPRNLRVDIWHDRAWPVFYHSPTFRNTSHAYKRWLSDHVILKYKLPGEKFFTGLHCFSELYYIKSGIVQILSSDDSIAPTISVTGGTIFGDTSFYTPPINRKVYARCLTYCEVFTLSRTRILKSLHLFPSDRAHIMKQARARLKHARALFALKESYMRGIDSAEHSFARTEGEGIAWLKRRWWEISDIVRDWKASQTKKSCIIPPEEEKYHCVKFIGQLVLCKDVLLRKKSLFLKVEFPWVLAPNSKFNRAWNKIVLVTVYVVLLFLPPMLVRAQLHQPVWFREFMVLVDMIYISDIIVTILTAKAQLDAETKILNMIVERFKDSTFMLDLLSTPFLDFFFTMDILKGYEHLVEFNRLFKTYLLFHHRTKLSWSRNHRLRVCIRILLTVFCAMYFVAYFVFMLAEISEQVTPGYYFGHVCTKESLNSTFCELREGISIMSIAVQWVSSLVIFSDAIKSLAQSNVDLTICSTVITFYVAMFISLEMYFVAALYCNQRRTVNYQYYVSKWLNFYSRQKLHKTLEKRLRRYLFFHWRHHKGTDWMQPDLLSNEPYDVYWKVHGHPAEIIIRESAAFKGANPELIKELAQKAKFYLMPKRSVILAFGVFGENVTYLVNGKISYEYRSKDNQLLQGFCPPGEILACATVFFGQASVADYFACTDIEILTIRIQEFVTVIQHYPEEWDFFKSCIDEFAPAFDELYTAVLTHEREKTDDARFKIYDDYVIQPDKIRPEKPVKESKILNFFRNYRKDPESTFIKSWCTLRACCFFNNSILWSIEGVYGPILPNTHFFVYKLLLLRAIPLIDIFIKCFLPFYNKNGLVISDIGMCMMRYLTHNFPVDILAWMGRLQDAILKVIGNESKAVERLIQSILNFTTLYVFTGYFDYVADVPTNAACYIQIIKWQLVLFFLTLTGAYFYTLECVTPIVLESGETIYEVVNGSCWMPFYYEWKTRTKTIAESINLIFAQSISVVLGAYSINPIGANNFYNEKVLHTVIFIGFASFFLYQKCLCTAALTLHHRGNYLTKYGVNQLQKFLESERIDKALIKRAVNQFNYWWRRSAGVGKFRTKVSVVFQQDLNYYFYKGTLRALDTLLGGGESVTRQLAGQCDEMYLEDKEDVLREMQLANEVFIVNRGKVRITQNGRYFATLTKGCMFGVISGTTSRPVNITATTDGRADVLYIDCLTFQATITNNIRETMSRHPQYKFDFITLPQTVPESPQNTIEYITRDKKVMQLPKMVNPVAATENAWYGRWLLWSWVIGPVLVAGLAQLHVIVPSRKRRWITIVLFLLDLLHMLYLATEIFTMRMFVQGMKCRMRYIGWRKIFDWWLIIDVFSIVIPIVYHKSPYWELRLMRMLRIYTIFLYKHHFHDDFGSRLAKSVMRIFLIILLMHSIVCGWIMVHCRSKRHMDDFPVPNYLGNMPKVYRDMVNSEEWIDPSDRKEGCPRSTNYMKGDELNRKAFVVPADWRADYLMALTHFVVLHTHTNLDTMLPFTTGQILFRSFTMYVIYIVWLWICSITINAGYTSLRQMYHYDFHVYDLIKYLKTNGVCSSLLQYVQTYTSLLWKRHQGKQLPEIVHYAPICLRVDIFTALYMYHLKAVGLFQGLPEYFLKQMVIRLKRHIIFPGKYVVQEGDIQPCLYFIHEGEVEKWYTDKKGEFRMATVLSINGFFGILPSLFPDAPWRFSYLCRTIVDIVALQYDAWKDLLERYPEVRTELYTAARKLKEYKYATKIYRGRSYYVIRK